MSLWEILEVVLMVVMLPYQKEISEKLEATYHSTSWVR